MSNLAWGGYSNGKIPGNKLAEVSNFVPVEDHASATALSDFLRPDAKKQLTLLQAAFRAHFGKNLNVSEAYRSYDQQVLMKKLQSQGGALAATPGTSIHGWGLAIDFGSNVATYGTAEKNWMNANAPAYGWVPAGDSFSTREAWHFEFTKTPIITTASVTPPVVINPTPAPEEDIMASLADLKSLTDPILAKLNQLIQTPETQAGFIAQVDGQYMDVLGRHADAGGSGMFVGLMTSGWNIGQVRDALIASDEYAERWVANVYKFDLGRDASVAEAKGWVAWKNTNGKGLADIQAAIRSSAEYKSKH